jgi:steroid delta-isomerase-like uncharacterized protein
MDIESNKRLVAKHVDRFNARDVDGFAATFAEDARNHAAIPEAQGRAGARRIMEKLLRAFPDMQMKVEDMVAEGDRVVCRLTVTGTHDGPLEFTRMPLPPTGKPFRTGHIHVFRVDAGQIVERWAERDDIGMLQQLGLFPAPSPVRGAEVRP